MKKLIISEVISVILVLGVFLLGFTQLNGWEKAGQERYGTAVVAVVVAAVVAAVAAIAAFVATVGAAVGAVGAVVVATVGVAVAAVGAVVVAAVGAVGAAVDATLAVAIVAAVAIVVVVVAVAVGDREIMEKINNASKKAIWLSMAAETAAIVTPIILITFC